MKSTELLELVFQAVNADGTFTTLDPVVLDRQIPEHAKLMDFLLEIEEKEGPDGVRKFIYKAIGNIMRAS